MPKLEDPFHEECCQNRIKGMSGRQAFKMAWFTAHDELGMKTRDELGEIPHRSGWTEDGLPVLPRLPDDASALGSYSTQFFKRPHIIDRIHELKQEMRASEMPDLLTYAVCGFQEIAARCMQEKRVVSVGGQDIGEWKFDSTGAINAFKGVMAAAKLKFDLGESAAEEKDIKQLEKALAQMRKDLGLDAGPKASAARGAGDPEGTSEHEDPSVSALQ